MNEEAKNGVRSRPGRSSGQKSHDIITNVRIAVPIVVLFAAVSTARYMFGLSAGIAIMVGGFVGYVLSAAFARYALPRLVVASDEPGAAKRLTRYWLIWILPSLLIFHFGVHFSWIWSCTVMVAIVGFALVLVWRAGCKSGGHVNVRQ